MNSFTLNNGITMPALGFGTFKMNGEECAQSVAEAIRCGYRMIDIPTEHEILAMMKEIRENPQDFRFVA